MSSQESLKDRGAQDSYNDQVEKLTNGLMQNPVPLPSADSGHRRIYSLLEVQVL